MKSVSTALLLVLASAALAAPPELVDKGPVVAPLREPTFFSVKADPKKKLQLAKTYDTKVFSVVRLWSDDPAVYDFQVFPKAAGTFYVGFFQDGESPLVVEVKAGGTTPPVTPPPIEPPPVTPTDTFYFACVRQDQNNAGFESLMKLPAWDELRAKGHTVLDIPVSQLPTGLTKPTTLPSVVVLRKAGDKWVDTGKNRDMPMNDEAVRNLLK